MQEDRGARLPACGGGVYFVLYMHLVSSLLQQPGISATSRNVVSLLCRVDYIQSTAVPTPKLPRQSAARSYRSCHFRRCGRHGFPVGAIPHVVNVWAHSLPVAVSLGALQALENARPSRVSSFRALMLNRSGGYAGIWIRTKTSKTDLNRGMRERIQSLISRVNVAQCSVHLAVIAIDRDAQPPFRQRALR